MELIHNDEVYAIHAPLEVKDGTEWFGKETNQIQASRMSYEAGKTFRPHKHLINPRILKRTQEAFIVIYGVLKIEMFAEDKTPIGSFEVSEGEIALLYKGYHKITVVEDCVAYEVKTGSFDGYLTEEKEYLE